MTTSDSTQAPSQTSSQPAVPDKTAAASPAPAATGSAAAAPATTTTAAAPAASAEPKPTETSIADPAKVAADLAAKATADKAAADKATADKAAADAAAAAEVYELAPPKGVTFDPALAPALGPVFKDLKLPKAAGEKLVTAFLEYTKALPAKMLARDLEVTMKDPELGLLNWGKTQGTVNEALAAFTTPEFRQKLERWGIANDLEFVRVFASIGKAMRGDTAARGSPTTVSEESMADRIYGRAQKVQAN